MKAAASDDRKENIDGNIITAQSDAKLATKPVVSSSALPSREQNKPQECQAQELKVPPLDCVSKVGSEIAGENRPVPSCEDEKGAIALHTRPSSCTSVGTRTETKTEGSVVEVLENVQIHRARKTGHDTIQQQKKRLDYSLTAWTLPPSQQQTHPSQLETMSNSIGTEPLWKKRKNGKVLAPAIVCNPAIDHATDRLEHKIWPDQLAKFNPEVSCAVCHAKPSNNKSGIHHCSAVRVDCVSFCTYLLCAPCFHASYSTVRRSASVAATTNMRQNTTRKRYR